MWPKNLILILTAQKIKQAALVLALSVSALWVLVFIGEGLKLRQYIQISRPNEWKTIHEKMHSKPNMNLFDWMIYF